MQKNLLLTFCSVFIRMLVHLVVTCHHAAADIESLNSTAEVVLQMSLH